MYLNFTSARYVMVLMLIISITAINMEFLCVNMYMRILLRLYLFYYYSIESTNIHGLKVSVVTVVISCIHCFEAMISLCSGNVCVQ